MTAKIPWPGPATPESGGVSGDAFTYILLNKPTQVVSTVNDPQGAPPYWPFCLKSLSVCALPVGRLDYFSQGLIILTNDGDLTYRLTHPKWHLPKVYHVLVRGGVTESALRAAMREGMTLSEGESVAPVPCRILRATPKNDTWLEMTLIQGINRQIRRMLRDLNLTILVLLRISQGPLALGTPPRGGWRHLGSAEVEALQKGSLKARCSAPI